MELYCYNLFGVQQIKIHGPDAMEPGERQMRVEFDYEGGGFDKGGTASLYVDGGKVGEGRIPATVPLAFSLDETADVGRDTGTSVTDDLEVEETEFTGRIRWVQMDAGEDAKDADHYISADERFKLAMAKQ